MNLKKIRTELLCRGHVVVNDFDDAGPIIGVRTYDNMVVWSHPPIDDESDDAFIDFLDKEHRRIMIDYESENK